MVNILMSNMSLDKKWCRLELRDYIKPESRVAIFGFQFYDERLRSAGHWDEFYDKKSGAFYKYLTEPFAFFGVGTKSIKWINYFKDTPASALRKIKNSDVLVLTDGIAERMIEIIDGLELTDAIKSYKGVVIGYGAGAVIQLSDYQLEPCLYRKLGYLRGLGLVDNIGIEINFESCDAENISIRRFLEEKKKPLYAITDDGAVVADNGGISTLGDVYVINFNGELECTYD